MIGTKLGPAPAPFTPPGAPAGFVIVSTPLPGEARALLRLELKDLDVAIARAIPKAADRETRAHLEDTRLQIKDILDPEEK